MKRCRMRRKSPDKEKRTTKTTTRYLKTITPGDLSSKGEHGQDQDWTSCRIPAIFSDQDWIWIFIFEKKLEQDRIRILV